jgi:hypothetical protein
VDYRLRDNDEKKELLWCGFAIRANRNKQKRYELQIRASRKYHVKNFIIFV